MSEYCTIKGYECGLSLGENRCVMDKPCTDIAEWIAEHDRKLLDKVAEKLKANYPLNYYKFGMFDNDTLHKDIDEVIEEMKAKIEKVR